VGNDQWSVLELREARKYGLSLERIARRVG
jgi:hypothetical protein